MKRTNIFEKAFTLVELLIVIALIAILSVAVLATINPIEQSNKARDAQFKNDAAEVLSAYERYYASQNNYPWGSPASIGATVMQSDNDGFGVVAVGDTGVLVSTSELKSSFATKEPFDEDSAPVDRLYVYNNGGDSNYVCFVPKARANRSKLGELRCLGEDGTFGEPNDGGTCEAYAEDSDNWTVASDSTYLSTTIARFLCVPETAEVADVTPAAD